MLSSSGPTSYPSEWGQTFISNKSTTYQRAVVSKVLREDVQAPQLLYITELLVLFEIARRPTCIVVCDNAIVSAKQQLTAKRCDT